MLTFYKLALAPALIVQGRWLRKNALRLPEPAGFRSGATLGNHKTEPIRLLFVGDSSAAGVGVEQQKDALAHQVAELVSNGLRKSVSWQLVAKSGLNTAEAAIFVRQHKLSDADIIVSAFGVNDVTSQRTAAQFTRDYMNLIMGLCEITGAKFNILSGLPPLHILPAAPQPLRWYLGQCAARLDMALKRMSVINANFAFVSLQWAKPEQMARDKFHPGLAQYKQWAELVAAEVFRIFPAVECAAEA